jgi:hypothetical protein
MHFDTEEASLAAGRLVHPVVSSVTYLSGVGRSDPTVVLSQRVDDLGADYAHVSHPKADCVLVSNPNPIPNHSNRAPTPSTYPEPLSPTPNPNPSPYP